MNSGVDTQVLVVGAGPTGLLLAAELCRRGVECVLIDARQDPLQWDRATIVHPRSVEVFAALGIADRFLEAGVKQPGIRIYSAGEVLGEMDLSECGSPFGFNLNLSEEVTERILAGFLEERGGTVRRGHRMVDLEAGEDSVVATIEHEGGRERVGAEWVVGCGGLHSLTRELSGIELDGHDIAEPWAVFDVTLEGFTGEFDFNHAYLETNPVILTPLPERRWRVYLRPCSPDSDLVEDAATVLARYQPGATLLDVANPTRFHCHSKVAERYRSGRVLIAGDAAHICTPAQGHGMNSGLQDAFNLGWKLALVCQGHAGQALLDSYEEERRPVAAAIVASGDAFERMQTLGSERERAARDREVRATFADPTSRHHEEIAEVELDITYAGSSIVSGASSHLAAGERLADDELRELTQRRTGHTVLVLAGPSASPRLREQALERVEDLAAGSPLIDAVLALGIGPDGAGQAAELDPELAARLGVEDVTVLAVRPDGHVGLRFEGADPAPLERYLELLRSS